MTSVVHSYGILPAGTGTTAVFSITATTAGNLVVLELGVAGGSTKYTSVAITDNGTGNTWVISLSNAGSSGTRQAFVAYCLSISAGVTQVTATFSGGSGNIYGPCALQEVNGSGTWTLDKDNITATCTGTGITITNSAADVGTTDFVAVAISVGNGNSATGLDNPPTGYTVAEICQDDNANTSGGCAYRINSSAVTDTITWNSSAGLNTGGPGVLASFKVTSTGVTGTAAITEGHDSVAATASASVSGSAAVAEGHDSAAASGALSASGTASITEQPDSASASGSVSTTGTAAVTETHDTVAATGSNGITGTAAITEGADTVAASGAEAVTGTAAVVEGPDGVAGVGSTAGGITAAGRHRKRYAVRDGDRVLVFDNKADANAARRLRKPQIAAIVTAPELPKTIKTRPAVIELPEVEQLATTYQELPRFEQYQHNQDHEFLVRLHEELRDREAVTLVKAILEHERAHLPVLAQALKHVVSHLQARQRRRA